MTSEFSANSGHFRNASRQKGGPMGKRGAHSPNCVGRRAEGCGKGKGRVKGKGRGIASRAMSFWALYLVCLSNMFLD